jgi:hypothetical protein
MATFSPPTDNFVSWADAQTTGILAYLRPGPRGRNVFKLADGVYSENQPANAGEVEKTYYGGHIYELTAAEEVDLTQAGYGDYITA